MGWLNTHITPKNFLHKVSSEFFVVHNFQTTHIIEYLTMKQSISGLLCNRTNLSAIANRLFKVDVQKLFLHSNILTARRFRSQSSAILQSARNAHGAEVRATHGAESHFQNAILGAFCSQIRVKTQVKLIFPSEFVARFR